MVATCDDKDDASKHTVIGRGSDRVECRHAKRWHRKAGTRAAINPIAERETEPVCPGWLDPAQSRASEKKAHGEGLDYRKLRF